MGSASFPSILFSGEMSSNSSLFISEERNSYKPWLFPKFNHKNSPQIAYVSSGIHSGKALTKRSFSSRHTGLSLVAFGAKELGPKKEEEDHRALETVLNLHKAIKNQNLTELSETIGEECCCICNFISAFKPFHGKKQVLDFFSFLIQNLGNNIEFVMQPTLHQGMTVGVSWKLEWKKTHAPLGKGFSFYMCHIYQGKVVIRNVEMLMEPILHVEPLRLKMVGFLMNVRDKISSQSLFKSKVTRGVWMLFTLFYMAAELFFIRLSLYVLSHITKSR